MNATLYESFLRGTYVCACGVTYLVGPEGRSISVVLHVVVVFYPYHPLLIVIQRLQ
jgi:hypothetical protein